MIKELNYNSYSASPSDYICPDGELSCALNCIHEDGVLKSLGAPKVLATDITGNVLAIHRVPGDEHFIMHNDNSLYWANVDNIKNQVLLHAFDLAIQTVTPIGNTLAALDMGGTLHYILWKDNSYKYLGTQLPELDARPYLCTHIYDNTEMERIFGVEFDEELPSVNLTSNGLNSDLTKKLYDAKTSSLAIYGTVRQNIYERIFALFNMFDRILKQKGYFTSPFFVRFAYRLYDGRHAMHTAPVLLVPTTWGKPLTTVHIKSDGTVIFNPILSASSLSANIDLPEDFSDWSDIVTHIDTFVTQQSIDYTDSPEAIVSLSQLPYYSYEPVTENGSPEWVADYKKTPQFMSNDLKWRSVVEEYEKQSHYKYYLSEMRYLKEGSKHSLPGNEFIAIDVSNGPVKLYIQGGETLTPITGDTSYLPLPERGNYDVYLTNYGGGSVYMIEGPTSKVYIYKRYTGENATYNTCHHYIELRRTDGKDFIDILTDYNNFYTISELDVKSYPTGFSGAIPLKKSVLVNLVTMTTLSDNGQARSKDVFENLFSYNNRLNATIKEEGLPSCSSLKTLNPVTFVTQTISPQYMSAYVKVMENSQICYYKLPDEGFVDSNLVYFAYPRSTATELILCSSSSRLHISLQRHPFLNLAYAFNMFNKLEGTTVAVDKLTEYPNGTIKYGNKIKTSPVNNPFVFSEEHTSELAVGKIYALSTAAKPLSQGQFGQFPLYAFTDEGVWALEVTNQGTYAGKQPITRDVVINPDSITQIDSAVLFVTDRGIMLISGSTTQCISDILISEEQFNITEFPKSDALINIFNNRAGDARAITLNDITMLPFSEFLVGCRMVYDYTNQRIIVYNPAVRYAYVYSLKSKMWGMMLSNIVENINSYPEALAMADGAKLVDFSKTDADTTTSLVITRPFKLGDPDSFKTINTIIQRGMFRSTHVRQVLYGSNDLYHWHTVWSSVDRLMRGFRGTPYKAYRLALICNFDKGESISGCTVVFEPRMGNKVR